MITASNVRNGVFVLLAVAVAAAEACEAILPGSAVLARIARVLWLLLAAVAVCYVVDRALRGAGRRFGALNDLARRLSHPIDLQSILDAGLQHSVRLLGAEAGCIRLFDQGDLAIAASVDLSPTYVSEHQHLEPSGLVREVMERGEPCALSASSVPEEVGALRPERTPRFVVLVPLISKGTVLGLIMLTCRKSLPAIKTELETLRAIGTQLAIAVANGQAYEGLLRESRTDPLTGVGSRRYFDDLYRREVARARRHGRPISMALVDVDHFKEINDTWGHPTGDQVLQEVARLLQGCRAGDAVARYGGDEFVVMMADSSQEQAETAVDRIRGRLDDLNASRRFPFPVQLSIGVRQMTSLDADLIAEADQAMYEDKRRRRADERLLGETVPLAGSEPRPDAG